MARMARRASPQRVREIRAKKGNSCLNGENHRTKFCPATAATVRGLAQERNLPMHPHDTADRSHGPLAKRLWRRVEKTSTCWNWLGAIKENGYGSIGRGGKGGGMVYTHRAAWELTFGPLADGQVLDHLCRNRRCCNPAHLEIVSQKVNSLRGSAPNILAHLANTCLHGHLLTPDNTYEINDSKRGLIRRCRLCRRRSDGRYRATHPDRKRRKSLP